MVPNTPQSCPLLWQPTDIIVYLSTFMNTRTKVRVKHTSSRFFKLFRDHVPVTVKINNPKTGLKFVNMFKKLSLEVIIDEVNEYRAGIPWGIPVTNREFSEWDVHQLAPYITRLCITYGCNITDEMLQHLHNLTYLSVKNHSGITNKGIQHMVHLTHLSVKTHSGITNKGIQHMVHLKYLDVGNMFDIDYDTLQALTKLERLYVRHNTTLTDDDVRRMPQLKLLSVGWDSPISVEVTKGRDLLLFKDQKLVTSTDN